MGRSRALDWLLLATLLPAYLVIQGVAVHGALTHGLWRYPFEITGAQGPAGYPVVNDGWDQPFRVGDRVLRFGDVDLQGLSLADVWNAMASVLNDGRPYQVEVERGGERLELTVTPTLYPYWWWRLPVSLSLALAATFLLLRAPHWHLARRFFAGILFFCFVRSFESMASAEPVLVLAADVARSLAAGLLLSCFFEWTEAARPLATWQRALPWAIGLVILVVGAVSQLLVFPTWPWLDWIMGIARIVFGAAGLLGLARAYRRAGALERRQVRWVLLGLSVMLLPQLLFAALGILGSFPTWRYARPSRVSARPRFRSASWCRSSGTDTSISIG